MKLSITKKNLLRFEIFNMTALNIQVRWGELRKTKLPSCLIEHKSKIVSNTRLIEYKDNKYVKSLGKH